MVVRRGAALSDDSSWTHGVESLEVKVPQVGQPRPIIVGAVGGFQPLARAGDREALKVACCHIWVSQRRIPEYTHSPRTAAPPSEPSWSSSNRAPSHSTSFPHNIPLSNPFRDYKTLLWAVRYPPVSPSHCLAGAVGSNTCDFIFDVAATGSGGERQLQRVPIRPYAYTPIRPRGSDGWRVGCAYPTVFVYCLGHPPDVVRAGRSVARCLA